MSKKIFNCKICQQHWDNLKDWEVKKKDAMESSSGCCYFLHEHSIVYEGRELWCQECKSASFTQRANICGDFDPNFKHNQVECRQLQKNKLEQLERKSDRTEEEKAEMIRLGKSLGISPSDRYDKEREEREKKALEVNINMYQQGLNTINSLREQGLTWHAGCSDYDKENLEKQLTKAKEEYKSKFGELPSSLRDNNDSNHDNQERERERETSNNYGAELPN